MEFTLLSVSFAAIALLITWLYNFNTWYYVPKLKPGKPPLPPGSLGFPIFGNMWEFLRAFKSDNPEAFISSFISKYGRGGLYRAYMFRQPTVLATTPGVCQAVLCNRHTFEIGWPKRVAKYLTGEGTLSTVTGEEHMKLSKLIKPSINSPRAIEHQLPCIEKNVKETLRAWAQQGNITLLDEARLLTLKNFHRILLGEDTELDFGEVTKLVHKMNRGFRAFPLYIPGTAYSEAIKARNIIRNQMLNILNQRKTCKERISYGDTLTMLMETTNENGEYLSDDQIVNLLVTFLSGGFDSIAHLITWMVILLKENPRVFDKLKAEQDAIALNKISGENLTISDIKSMTYMSQVMDETLRLVNIAPFTFREVLVDVELNGYTIPKGWFVESWARHIHLDPLVYTNPKEFNPERWTDVKPLPNTFLPFGMGNRKCPGINLTRFQSSVFLHHLIVHYKWQPLNPNYKLSYLPHPRPSDHYPVKIIRRVM